MTLDMEFSILCSKKSLQVELSLWLASSLVHIFYAIAQELQVETTYGFPQSNISALPVGFGEGGEVW